MIAATPRLSFVVAAFASVRSLRTCLSSLLDQTIPSEEIEIIVCDNTPDMGTASMIRELCLQLSPAIRYEWTSSRTTNVPPDCRHSRCLYTATEIGVELATGTWLTFPNADSYYAPVFAERMLRAAELTGCDLLYCDFVLGREDKKYLVMEAAPASGYVDKTDFIIRRNLFTGFPDKTTCYELADGMLIERLARAGVNRRRVAEVLCFHS